MFSFQLGQSDIFEEIKKKNRKEPFVEIACCLRWLHPNSRFAMKKVLISFYFEF